ncbi:hypothetical protein BDN72DRAFT_958770 [Pluteus cervinus]|uniref:Uncharacterized protein n=1 Tax=Pluteus cervinus TaxID=181527 RepID=A0ACD3AXJ7_9AGAR|nr:hypothetical protein BDN72DRAFT_958770 [Pluteus cervinus]
MALFEGIKFHISLSIPDQKRTQITSLLSSNGATEVDDVQEATHIISNSHRFEGWQDVDPETEVVTDSWVERSMVLGKLQGTTFYSADPAMIFSGVVACATELPAPDLEVLSAGITALGGQWRTGLTKDVTHLFAISNTSHKYATALHFQHDTHIKVLLPHWFDDAVRLGMGRLNTEPYEWPDPQLLRVDPAKPQEEDGGKKKLQKLDAQKRSLFKTVLMSAEGDEVPDLNVKNVWGGRKIVLSAGLGLREQMREAVAIGIDRAKGMSMRPQTKEEELEMVGDCDILVTRYRSGKAYVKAVREGKTIGTLAWLFHVQSTGVMTRPMDQLLHYPIPKKPIPGFMGHEITVTNYTGEAREYLKKLITTMGATFTPSMSGRNTALIAAYISGTKTSKAASWSIPIVNHTWLEDCFIKWRNLTVGTEKYIVFPPGVDFSVGLGERGIGKSIEDIDEEDLLELEAEDDEEEEEAEHFGVAPTDAKEDRDGDVVMVGDGEDADKENRMDVDERPVSKRKAKPASKTKDVDAMSFGGTQASAREVEAIIEGTSRDIDFDDFPPDDDDFELPERIMAADRDGLRDMEIDDEEDEAAKVKGKKPSKTSPSKAKPGRRSSGVHVDIQSPPPPKVQLKPQETKSGKKKTTAVTSVFDNSERAEKATTSGGRLSSTMKPKGVTASAPSKVRAGGTGGRKKGDRTSDDEEEEDEEVLVSAKKAKGKGKENVKQTKTPRKVIHSEEEEEPEPEAPSSPLSSPSPPSRVDRNLVRRASGVGLLKFVDDQAGDGGRDVDDDDERGVVRVKSAKAQAQAKSSKGKAKARQTDDEEEEEEEEEEVSPKKITAKPKPTPVDPKVSPVKRYGKTLKEKRALREQPESSGLDDEVEVMDELRPAAKAKGKAQTTKGEEKGRGRKKQKDASSEDDADDDDDFGDYVVVKKPTKKAAAIATPATTSKKKKPSRDEEEDEESEDVSPSRRRKEQQSKPKKKGAVVSSEEEEDTVVVKRKPRKDPSPIPSEDEEEPPKKPIKTTKARAEPAKPTARPRRRASGGKPIETEEEDVVTDAKGKARTKANEKATAASSSKRPISIVVPGLDVVTRNAGSVANLETEEKKKKAAANKKKGKAPASEEEEEEEGEEEGESDAHDSESEEEMHIKKKGKPLKVTKESSSSGSSVTQSAVQQMKNLKVGTAEAKGAKGKSAGKAPQRDVPMDVDDVVTPAKPKPKPRASRPVETGDADGQNSPPAPGISPVSTMRGSVRRNAATKAEQKLRNEIMPDVLSFESQLKKHMKSGGRASFGGAAAPEELIGGSKNKKSKRPGREEEAEEAEEEERDKKKRKLAGGTAATTIPEKGKAKAQATAEEDQTELKRKSPTKPRSAAAPPQPAKPVYLMTTQVTLTDEEIRALGRLGAKFTSKPSECTHLVVRNLVRTEKFLCALAVAPHILTADWVKVSIAAKALQPEDKYQLHDKDNEEKYGVKLTDALERSRKLSGKLLAGKTFYFTPKIHIDAKLLRNVVTACGGQSVGSTPTLRILNAQPNRIIISCPEDVSIWRPISAQHPIYSPELILSSALKQDVDWDNLAFRVEGSI